jgi:hypothetical protein
VRKEEQEDAGLTRTSSLPRQGARG